MYGEKVKLRNKQLSDVHTDYAWQCDPELASLDANAVLNMPFSEYLLNYVHQVHNPPAGSFRFAIETLDKSRHIGNCTYYNIDLLAENAELGIMIGDHDYWDKGYGTDAVITLVNHIFSNTVMKRLHLKTLEGNARAQRCFEKCYFTAYGHCCEDGYEFLRMELTREKWQERNSQQGEYGRQATTGMAR